MGRPRQPNSRNWQVTINLTKKLDTYLTSIAKKLGLSRSSVISELIEKFGEELVKSRTSADNPPYHGEGEDPAGEKPPVSTQQEELREFRK